MGSRTMPAEPRAVVGLASRGVHAVSVGNGLRAVPPWDSCRSLGWSRNGTESVPYRWHGKGLPRLEGKIAHGLIAEVEHRGGQRGKAAPRGRQSLGQSDQHDQRDQHRRGRAGQFPNEMPPRVIQVVVPRVAVINGRAAEGEQGQQKSSGDRQPHRRGAAADGLALRPSVQPARRQDGDEHREHRKNSAGTTEKRKARHRPAEQIEERSVVAQSDRQPEHDEHGGAPLPPRAGAPRQAEHRQEERQHAHITDSLVNKIHLVEARQSAERVAHGVGQELPGKIDGVEGVLRGVRRRASLGLRYSVQRQFQGGEKLRGAEQAAARQGRAAPADRPQASGRRDAERQRSGGPQKTEKQRVVEKLGLAFLAGKGV